MTTEPLAVGTIVTVLTDQGHEVGMIIGHSTPEAGHLRYTVRFSDRTQSSWAAHQVHAVAS